MGRRLELCARIIVHEDSRLLEQLEPDPSGYGVKSTIFPNTKVLGLGLGLGLGSPFFVHGLRPRLKSGRADIC